MDTQLMLELGLVFVLFALLRPVSKLLIYKFNVHVTAVYGIAAVMSFATLLAEPGGIVRSNIEIVLITYMLYAWLLENRYSRDHPKV